MKIKAIKYNKNGLTRAENSAPKLVMPKKDLIHKNIKISENGHYISVSKKVSKKKP